MDNINLGVGGSDHQTGIDDFLSPFHVWTQPLILGRRSIQPPDGTQTTGHTAGMDTIDLSSILVTRRFYKIILILLGGEDEFVVWIELTRL
jgi:hypothetical protein